MSGPMPDADHVRVSALMLLQEHARKGDGAARAAYRKNLEFLNRQKPESELRSEDMAEFIRQILAAEAGQPVTPKVIGRAKPQFRTEPVKEQK